MQQLLLLCTTLCNIVVFLFHTKHCSKQSAVQHSPEAVPACRMMVKRELGQLWAAVLYHSSFGPALVQAIDRGKEPNQLGDMVKI